MNFQFSKSNRALQTFVVMFAFALLFLFMALTARAQDRPAAPASQAEVDAGVIHSKYVAPDTLKNWSGGGGGGGSSSNVNSGVFTNVSFGTLQFFWQSNKISSTNIALDFTTNSMQRYTPTNDWVATNIYFTLSQSITNRRFVPFEYLVIEGNTNGVHVILPPTWIWLSEGGAQQAPTYVSTGAVLHVTIQNMSDGKVYAHAGYGVAFEPDVDEFFRGLSNACPSCYDELFPPNWPGPGAPCGEYLKAKLYVYASQLKNAGIWGSMDMIYPMVYAECQTGTNRAFTASLNLKAVSVNPLVWSDTTVGNFSSQGVVNTSAAFTGWNYDAVENPLKGVSLFVCHSEQYTNDSGSTWFNTGGDTARIVLRSFTNMQFNLASDQFTSVIASNSVASGGHVSMYRPDTNGIVLLLNDGSVAAVEAPLVGGESAPVGGSVGGGATEYMGMLALGNAMPGSSEQAFRTINTAFMASLGRVRF